MFKVQKINIKKIVGLNLKKFLLLMDILGCTLKIGML